MSFGLSPSLRFRDFRYRSSPSFYVSLFRDACLLHAGAPNSTSPQFKKEATGKERLISKRFSEVGGEKLKAP